MVRTLLTSLVLCSAFVLVVGGDEPPDRPVAYKDKQTGLSFPREFDDLKYDRMVTYPDRALGVAVRYLLGGTLKTDVFIYNYGLEKIPSDLDAKEVEEHLVQVVGDVEAAGKAGALPNLTLQDRTVISLGDGETAPKAH